MQCKSGCAQAMEINFPLKASPGRGKLSPQVTDEGARQQYFALNTPHPSAHCVRSHLPPPPKGGKAFCSSQTIKLIFVCAGGQNKKRRADARLSWKTKLDYLFSVFFSAFFR